MPGDWIKYTTTLITPFEEISPTSLRVYGRPDRWGHGALWWVWRAPMFPGNVSNGPLQGAVSAMGAGGQFITVLPREDMIVAHKVDIDADTNATVDAMSYHGILSMVIVKCPNVCK